MGVILLTGGSSGIGLCCAKELVARDQHVIIANRTAPELDLGDRATFVPLELSTRAAVKTFVKAWCHGTIDTLILNAGMISPGKPTSTEDGIETTFAINYLNQVYLFSLLRSAGWLASNCRFIFVTSAVHDPNNSSAVASRWTTPEAVAKATDAASQQSMIRYPNSKVADLLFVYALHRRSTATAPGQGMEVIAYAPGYVPDSGLSRGQGRVVHAITNLLGPVVRFVASRMGVVVATPTQSGRLMAELALKIGPFAIMEVDGQYILLDTIAKSSVESYDEAKSEELWNWTTKELGLELLG